MTRRIGLLGGTFDPIHLGHLDLAAAAWRVLGLHRLIIIPSHVPPHRPAPAASAFHRFAMVSLAIAGHDGWTASDTELLAERRSYTSDTLERLHVDGYAPEELYFLIGADAFREIESWKNFPAILNQAHFCVVARPGFALDTMKRALPSLASRMCGPDDVEGRTMPIILIDTPTADVSATAIRQQCAAGRSIDRMVPAAVAQHIAQHGLYRTLASDQRHQEQHRSQAAGRLHGQSQN